MRVLIHHRTDSYGTSIVETYSRSWVRAFSSYLGCEVFEIGEGSNSLDKIQGTYDLLLDIECGRNAKGELGLLGDQVKHISAKQSAVYFIDSHGNSTLHRRLAPFYDHVFFAVWARRELFEKHKSAHWCPNFTDPIWFNPYVDTKEIDNKYQFGFFGSKHGLDRADSLIRICKKHGWTYDVREIGKQWKARWPRTAAAMESCEVLFNHGQKHDGPNLRVMESLAMMKPLLCDKDERSGLEKLFTDGRHFLGYKDETELEEKMKWALDNPEEAHIIAVNGYHRVLQKHTVENRALQVWETVGRGYELP